MDTQNNNQNPKPETPTTSRKKVGSVISIDQVSEPAKKRIRTKKSLEARRGSSRTKRRPPPEVEQYALDLLAWLAQESEEMARIRHVSLRENAQWWLKYKAMTNIDEKQAMANATLVNPVMKALYVGIPDFAVYAGFVLRICKGWAIGTILTTLQGRFYENQFINFRANLGGDDVAAQMVYAMYDKLFQYDTGTHGMVRLGRATVDEVLSDLIGVFNYCEVEKIPFDFYLKYKIQKYSKYADFTPFMRTILSEANRPRGIDYEYRSSVGTGSGSKDVWFDVKAFLNLPDNTEFPDGYIPFGWGLAVSHVQQGGSLVDVKSVWGSGYYYTRDGKRYRGVRHYDGADYYLIRVTPETFGEFAGRWREDLRQAVPSLAEIKRAGAFSGYWDDLGKSLNSVVPDLI